MMIWNAAAWLCACGSIGAFIGGTYGDRANRANGAKVVGAEVWL